MDEKKIEYMKKHLEQAILNDNYNEVNNCYQSLLKYIDPADIPDLAQKVNDYNKTHSKNNSSAGLPDEKDVKTMALIAKKKHKTNVRIQILGLTLGVIAMIGSCVIVSSSYNDLIIDIGLATLIAGFVLVLIGAVFGSVKNKSFISLIKHMNELFRSVCANEDKLHFLDNIETLSEEIGEYTKEYYMGQTNEGVPHGFGIGFCKDYAIYIGEWEHGQQSGIGKYIVYDMNVILEGEFAEGKAHGVIDVIWEDGSAWHGEYKNDLPWDGQGKTFIGKKIKQGVWKKGLFIL